MAIDFLNPQSTTIVNGILHRTTSSETSRKKIESSKDVSGIEIRMLPPYIKDNLTTAVWPFPGYSKLYCLTIVVSDVTNQLAGAIDLKGFPRIGDNEYLPINKTIFYWQNKNEKDKAPNQVHIMCSVIKSKESLRDTGKILGEIKDDKNYKGLVGSLGKIAKDAAKFNVVTDIMVELAGVVGQYLGSVEDKPIGTVINSYTTLYGDFDNPGINPLLYSTPDADFKFEVVVRNKIIENKKLKSGSSSAKASTKAGSSRGENKQLQEDIVEVEMEIL